MTDLSAARRDGTVYVVAGALIAALGAYLYQFAGARVLGSAEFAPITVLWTVQFLVWTTILIPFEHTTVRRLAISPNHRLRTDVPLFGLVVAVTAVGVTIALYLARDSLLDGKALHAFQAGLIVIGYWAYAMSRGALAGRQRYRDFGIGTAGESVGRLLAGVVVLAVAATSVGLAWAMVAAPWLILALHPFRRVPVVGEHPEVGAATAFVAAFILGNAASHTILAAGPLVVGALGGDAEAISVFFVTQIIVRAPLTASYGLQSRLLEPLSRMVGEGRSAQLGTIGLRIVAGGAVLLVPAWLAGRLVVPTVIQLLFGSDFRPSATLAGLITTGVVAAIASIFTAQILVARGQTARLAVAWLAALGVAVVTVVLSAGTPEVRTAAGFLAGEVAALAAIAVVALTAADTEVAPAPVAGFGPAEDIL